MLGRDTAVHLHTTFAKTADRLESLEIRGLHEAEVVGTDAEDVVHENPTVFADDFIHRRSLARTTLAVNLLWLIHVAAIDVVADGHLDATGILLGAVGHAVATVGHGHDVGIEHLNLFVRIVEEQLRFGHESREVVVGIGIVEFRAALSRGADGEIDHQTACFGVVNRLWCPGTADVAEMLGEGLVDAERGVRPVDEVARLHQHQRAVVAPSVLLPVAFPFGVAKAGTLSEDVQVGGGDVIRAVGSAVDVRVADAVLLGDGVAPHDGSVAVQCRPVVAVAAQCHVQAMVSIFVIDHEVSPHAWLLGKVRRMG